MRDVVIVSEVASSGVNTTPRPPALGAVSVGTEEVHLEASGPGVLVRVSQLVRELEVRTSQKLRN